MWPLTAQTGTLRFFEKGELNLKRSDSITVGTRVHDETEEEKLNNVEYPKERTLRVHERAVRRYARVSTPPITLSPKRD